MSFLEMTIALLFSSSVKNINQIMSPPGGSLLTRQRDKWKPHAVNLNV